MKEILVSIECITYNHEEYIGKAIESFLMQKTDFNYEILIHDDASTDGTQEIIKKYQKRYPDIVKPILQIENQYSKGVNISLTYNYPRAKGKYIATCEGDDYWIDPYKLQKQVDYMEQNNDCTFCFTNANIIDESNNQSERIFVPYLNINKKYFSNCSRKYNVGELALLDFIPTATFFFPKRVLENLPNFFCEGMSTGDMKIKLIATAKGYAYFINEVTAVYRMNVPNSMMTSRKEFDKKKNIAVNEGYMKLIESINEYTDSKYFEQLEELKMRFGYYKLLHTDKKDLFENMENKKIFRKLKLVNKIKIIVNLYIPNIYNKLKKINNSKIR